LLTCWENDGTGVWIKGTGFVLQNINSDWSGKNGFYLSGNLIDCDTLYAGLGGSLGTSTDRAGFMIETVNYSRFQALYSEHNSGNGFYIQSVDHSTFIALESYSNQFEWVGYEQEVVIGQLCDTLTFIAPLITGDKAGIGIGLINTPTKITIIGGHIYMNTGTSYAIYYEGSGHRFSNIALVASTAKIQPASIGTDVIFSNNQGFIAPGEERTISGTIGTLTQDAFNAIVNPYGQNVYVSKVDIGISVKGTGTPNLATIASGIGSSATTDYNNLFTAIPCETVGLYDSFVAGDTGAQVKPLLWTAGYYLNMSIKTAAATGMVARYYITVIGQ
jgi:hypothetical protein